MIQIYKIDTTTINDNRYGVGRTEDWRVVLDKVFEDFTQAYEYVIDQSFRYTDLPLYTVDKTTEEKVEIVRRFCFDDNVFLTKRRFFIGKPDTEKIKHHLKQQHIIVQEL